MNKIYDVYKRSFYQGIIINGQFWGLQGCRWAIRGTFRNLQDGDGPNETLLGACRAADELNEALFGACRAAEGPNETLFGAYRCGEGVNTIGLRVSL